jgi:hypothetical protein
MGVEPKGAIDSSHGASSPAPSRVEQSEPERDVAGLEGLSLFPDRARTQAGVPTVDIQREFTSEQLREVAKSLGTDLDIFPLDTSLSVRIKIPGGQHERVESSGVALKVLDPEWLQALPTGSEVEFNFKSRLEMNLESGDTATVLGFPITPFASLTAEPLVSSQLAIRATSDTHLELTATVGGGVEAGARTGVKTPWIEAPSFVKSFLNGVSERLGDGNRFSALAGRIVNFLDGGAPELSGGAEGRAATSSSVKLQMRRGEGLQEALGEILSKNLLEPQHIAMSHHRCITRVETACFGVNGDVSVSLPLSGRIALAEAGTDRGTVITFSSEQRAENDWRVRFAEFLGEKRKVRIETGIIQSLSEEKGSSSSRTCACVNISARHHFPTQEDIKSHLRLVRAFNPNSERLNDICKFEMRSPTVREFLTGEDRLRVDLGVHLDPERVEVIVQVARDEQNAMKAYLAADSESRGHARSSGGAAPQSLDRVYEEWKGPLEERLASTRGWRKVLEPFKSLVSNENKFADYPEGRDLNRDVRTLGQAKSFQERFDRLSGNSDASNAAVCAERLRDLFLDLDRGVSLCTALIAFKKLDVSGGDSTSDASGIMNATIRGPGLELRVGEQPSETDCKNSYQKFVERALDRLDSWFGRR